MQNFMLHCTFVIQAKYCTPVFNKSDLRLVNFATFSLQKLEATQAYKKTNPCTFIGGYLWYGAVPVASSIAVMPKLHISAL